MPFKKKGDTLSTRLADARHLFSVADPENIGKLRKEDVVACAPLLKISPKEAARLFDALNINGDDTLELWEIEAQEKAPLWDAIPVRCFLLAVKLYLVVFIGALFFKTYGPESDNALTWIDAFYFATVVMTSVGY